MRGNSSRPFLCRRSLALSATAPDLGCGVTPLGRAMCTVAASCTMLCVPSYHTRTTALSNSMKLSHARGATQDGRVMVERSDRMWSTGEGNGKPLQYSFLENSMNIMKRQNYRTLKEELPSSVGAQYATGDQWRNNSRKNEGMEPKQNNSQLWM